MSKKILRINGQDVELSGSGGGAMQGIIDATDFVVQYLQNGGSLSDFTEVFAAWSGTIADLGYASAEELIRHASDITLFVDYAAMCNASGGTIDVEQGIFITLKLANLGYEIITIHNREALNVGLQETSLTTSDCDARLGEEVKYAVIYGENLSFLVGETRICGFNLNS